MSSQVQPVTYLSVDQVVCEKGGLPLFKPVSLTVQSGQMVLFSGNNGVGKTTLLESLSGLNTWHHGRIDRLPGADPLEWRRQSVYIGHKSGLKNHLSCEENLQFLARLKGFTGDTEALYDALHDAGLNGRELLLAGRLSAGQKKRLSLARLSLINCPLWILDEPAVNLDRPGQDWFNGKIHSHLGRGGAVLITAHNDAALRERCDINVHLEAA